METTLARKNKVAVNRGILNFTAKLVVKYFILSALLPYPALSSCSHYLIDT